MGDASVIVSGDAVGGPELDFRAGEIDVYGMKRTIGHTFEMTSAVSVKV